MAKKLTTGEQNLMKKYKLDLLNPDEAPSMEAINPFSGVRVPVNTLGGTIYELVMNMQEKYSRGEKINVSEFDRLRYLFLKLFPDAYMDLLD